MDDNVLSLMEIGGGGLLFGFTVCLFDKNWVVHLDFYVPECSYSHTHTVMGRMKWPATYTR